MTVIKRIKIRTQAVKVSMNDTIRHKVINDITNINGKIIKNLGKHRAYFPESILNEMFDDCKLLLSAYIDLNSGEFVAETTENQDWNGKTNQLSGQEYWKRCRDYLKTA